MLAGRLREAFAAHRPTRRASAGDSCGPSVRFQGRGSRSQEARVAGAGSSSRPPAESFVTAPSSPIEIGDATRGLRYDRHAVLHEVELDQLPTVKDGEGESFELRRQLRGSATGRPLEPRARCSNAAAGRACPPSRPDGSPRPSCRPAMSAMSLSSASRKNSHERLAVGSSEHPGVDDAAQGRAVRRALEVVVDRLRDRPLVEVVAESREDLAQLVGREEVEEHQARRPASKLCTGSECRPRPRGSGRAD